MATNPLKAFVDIKKQELPLTLLMFSYFFLVITVFWVLKPIKKTLFIGYYKASGGFQHLGMDLSGSQAELLAKVLNMGVAFVAVVAFSMLARRLRRQQLTYAFSAFSALSLLAFNVLGSGGGEAEVWLFYLFGDLFNTLMVATFFAFLNDSFSPKAAKRTYGAIILGGVCGGAFGSLFVRAQIESMSFDAWIWLCIGLTAVIAIVAWFAGAEVAKNPPPEADEVPEAAEKKADNAAIEGARLVGKSKYLLSIVVIVGVYEIVSTILDFQFSQTIETLSDDGEIGSNFATVYAITNSFALFVQIFLTGWVMNRFGVKTALLITPVAIIAVSAGYFIAPVLIMGGLLSTADNGLNYSMNQSSREALYTPTSRKEKYAAKAFIDMFIQRFAKALAVGVSLLITTIFTDFADLRYLSVITIAGALVWFFAARYAGRQFAEKTGENAPGEA